MSRFSKKTMNILKQAGWYLNRRADITKIMNHATQQGIDIGENIQSFLYEFDGLEFRYPDGKYLFYFVAELHTDLTYFNHFSYINNMTGEDSLIVGDTPDLLLVIGESGKMYGFAYFNCKTHVYELGECYDEGIEFVCKHGLNPFPYLIK